MFDFAMTCVNNGLSVIPTRPGTKQASIKWEQYQKRHMSSEEVKRYFCNGCQLALIGGAVSGNLECLDFDKPDLYHPFLDTLESINPDLRQRLTLRQKTPSGGFHLIYRCTEPVGGNTKLARSVKYTDDKGHPRQDVYIETRGEGGYFLVHPSYAVPHGRNQAIQYQLVGTFDAVPVVSSEERDFLHRLARSFDEGAEAHHPEETTTGADGDRPGDRFNRETDWHSLLSGYGWTPGGTVGDRQHWTRPGKTDGSTSATIHPDRGLYVFSTSTPLPNEKPVNKFAVYAYYEHNGDFEAEARALARRYGMDRPEPSKINCVPGDDRQGSPADPAGKGECRQEWPEPMPLIIREQSTPYPIDALPETIGAAVREVVGFVQCPVALGACSSLSAVSTVGQGLVDVRRAVKLEGPTSLFLLAVADSGERKTTVDGFFSRQIQQWEAEQAEAAKPELTRYQADSEAWTAKKGGLLTAIKEAAKGGKSTDSLEQSLANLETDKPDRPKVPRLLYADTTPEGLAHRLAHCWPVGGVLSSEAGTVLGSHGMKSDSAMRNMALLNSLWGAEPLTVDRRDESGSFALRGARLTMGLAVQSETVRTFLDGSKGLARGIGWLARFLVAWPDSTQGGRMFKEPPEHWPCLARFHRRLGTLLDHPLTFNDRGELVPETLELSPEAKSVWVAFHDDVEAELKPGRDMAEARDVASKAADNAARLAGLFHLFEHGPGGTISADQMRRAAAVSGWHLYEARRFMGEIALPPQLNSAAKLDAWLLEYCRQNRVDEVSTRHIRQYGPTCTRGKIALDGTLRELAEAGRVRVIEEGRRKIVKVNPALLGG